MITAGRVGLNYNNLILEKEDSMKIHPLAFLVLLLIPLSSCSPTTPVPSTVTPTLSPSPVPTLTPTPQPFQRRLFFDLNGSGLPDQAVFTYDPERFADPRQPFHPDLQIAIDNYLSDNPGMQDGDLITIEEPGLSGYQVCAGSTCVETDQDGYFSIPNLSGSSFLIVKITDPRSDDPALAMRYSNKWEGAVTVPAYTKDIDLSTMATLTIIPGCDADSEALVCKLDEDTLQVRDQHLNDTSIIPIDRNTILQGEEMNIGLMQGFLTSLFQCNQDYAIGVWNDHDLRPGFFLNYLGSTNPLQNPAGFAASGDDHGGTDFDIPDGVPVVAMAPGIVNWAGELFTGYGNGYSNHVTIVHLDGDFGTGTGHHSVLTVDFDDQIYRGQIIALSGHSGTWLPHVHLNLHHPYFGNPPPSVDPFGVLFDTVDISDFISYWSTYNTIICTP
jgi:hypothetical protein